MCTGNICRSPTAERLATMHSAQLATEDFRASSAGTRAVVGHPMHPDAAAVLESLGGDSSQFAARQVTRRLAAEADLVVTMTRAHRDAVLELAPKQLHRTFTLHEVARLVNDCGATTVEDLAALRPQLAAQDIPDVPDPIGQSPDFHAMVGRRIANLVPAVLKLRMA
ncbi:MAG: low molecular weight phosphatase family protein [Actinomycetota bacterium]|nr:low molecular weight phosphatase family protein [Actinomycetota bacterium]